MRRKKSILKYITGILLIVFVVPAAIASDAELSVDVLTKKSGLLDSLVGLIGVSEIYWPWWLGALVLGTITFSFWWAVRSPMSGSSSWQRIVGWREESRRQHDEKDVHAASKADVMQAMMAETVAHFGEASIGQSQLQEGAADAVSDKNVNVNVSDNELTQRAPWQAHITFLLMMGVGGLVASMLAGTFDVRFDMGADFIRIFGDGWSSIIVLLVGGIFIGFGTRMAGGCTIGHGLSGLSRMQLGSLLGTASFMGGAIVVSLILERIMQ